MLSVRQKRLVLALCLFFITFVKNCIFHYQCFQSFLIHSIFSDPLLFWQFWLNKIALPLTLAAFSLIFKKTNWTIFASFIFDLWIISNLFYFRINQFPLDPYALTETGNMKGFWGSVIGLLNIKDSLFFLLSISYSIVCVAISKKCQSTATLGIGIALLVASIICQTISMGFVHKRWPGKTKTINPFNTELIYDIGTNISSYCYYFSVFHLFFYDIEGLIDLKVNTKKTDNLSFSYEEECILYECRNDSPQESYSDKLIIILVESFESWVIKPEVMPNLSDFITQEHVLFADKVVSQTLGGTSADGQLIINTGLLPIANGATCFLYPNSTYPGIAKISEGQATALVPHSLDVWNQAYMSKAYGYDKTEQVAKYDDAIFSSILDHVRNGDQVIQALTLLSHLPFDNGAELSDLEVPDDMPSMLAKYIKCMNYTDTNLPIILSETKGRGHLEDATVIITGDHTIFWRDILHQFQQYSDQNSFNVVFSPNYCPLIIYSPHIEGNLHIKEQCYQMDIYTTIVNLLVDDVSWTGFGTDLLDSSSTNKTFSIDEAYKISDKVIRSNWFESHPIDYPNQ